MKKEDNNYSSENEEELDEIDRILLKKIEEVKNAMEPLADMLDKMLRGEKAYD